MNPEIDLSGLRDIHLLSKPSIWPLAMGWWILLAAVLIAIILILIGRCIWRRRPDIYAIRKARKLAAHITDDQTYLKYISQLLKRVGIVVYGRPVVAPLSDTKWQEFLLKEAPDTITKNEAHLIAFAPYEEKIKMHYQRDELTQHIELWIKKVFKNKKSS